MAKIASNFDCFWIFSERPTVTGRTHVLNVILDGAGGDGRGEV